MEGEQFTERVLHRLRLKFFGPSLCMACTRRVHGLRMSCACLVHVLYEGGLGSGKDWLLSAGRRQKLPGTLGEACLKTEWQVHAYCLMSNHLHFREELQRLGWPADGLRARPKGHLAKVVSH